MAPGGPRRWTDARRLFHDPRNAPCSDARGTAHAADRGTPRPHRRRLPDCALADADPEAPYLALRLGLDPALIAALLLELPGTDGQRASGIGIGLLDADLLVPVLRLVPLLDRPNDAAVLAPLIEREYPLPPALRPQGPMLRQIALAGSLLSQIAPAIAWIRENYQRPLRIDALASLTAMSPATLHRHFRAVTALSPLQYQKHVRHTRRAAGCSRRKPTPSA